jgi:hypothetical protein
MIPYKNVLKEPREWGGGGGGGGGGRRILREWGPTGGPNGPPVYMLKYALCPLSSVVCNTTIHGVVYEGALLPTFLCSLQRYYANITII